MIDVSKLAVVEDVTMPSVTRERTKQNPADNPLIPYVDKSIAEGTNGVGRSLGLPGIPAAEVRTLVNALRKAAEYRGAGLRVVLTDPATERALTLAQKTDDDGNPTGLDVIYSDTAKSEQPQPFNGDVNVLYRTQPRKQKKTKGTTADDSVPPDADATPDPSNTDTPVRDRKSRRR